MKLIGMLGGTSWPSTIAPYRMLNEEVARRVGPRHSARVALYSIDYSEIRDCYVGDWNEIPALLLKEIRTLLSFSPDCWMIANNTLHTIYDRIADQLPSSPPMFHAVHLVRDHLVGAGLTTVLLLGTRFTMEDGYYADPLRAVGIDVVIPEERDRERVQAIQTQLADGVVSNDFTGYFVDLLDRHAQAGCEAVILGCTELPLAIPAEVSAIAVIDPLALQCAACVDFALRP